jgi:hypothetical protein
VQQVVQRAAAVLPQQHRHQQQLPAPQRLAVVVCQPQALPQRCVLVVAAPQPRRQGVGVLLLLPWRQRSSG